MWFLVGMDITLLGRPSLAGLCGPFDSEEEAEAYRPSVEENGTTLELTRSTGPATYPGVGRS